MSGNWRGEDLALAAVLTALIACVVTSCVALADHLVRGWNGTGFVLLCSAVAAASYWAHRHGNGGQLTGVSGTRGRLAQVAVLLVVARLWTDWQDRNASPGGWPPEMDKETLIVFAAIFLIWAVASNVARIVGQLRRPLGDDPPRERPERRLATRYFAGGFILFVAAGLTQPHIAGFIHLPRSHDAGPLANVLLYFLLGMATLGQIHYATLRQRWHHQQVVVGPGLGGRWLKYSLGFIGIVMAVALVLPTSHTAGLLEPWRQAWEQILLLMRGPLNWLVRLLGHTAQPPRRAPPGAPPPPPIGHSHGGAPAKSSNWGALLQALFFWGAVAVTLIYLMRGYLQHRAGRLRLPRRMGGMASALGRVWAAIRRLLRGYTDGLAGRLPHIRLRRSSGADAGSGLSRYIRVGALSPREQAMRFYVSMVRRAAREGFPRHRSHTPYEFDTALSSRLPGAQTDVRTLTNAFVEARYSLHEFEAERVSPLRSVWQRVRSALGQL